MHVCEDNKLKIYICIIIYIFILKKITNEYIYLIPNKNSICYSSLTTSLSLPLRSNICETHDEKNMRLKRPMSPHLTIYQVQLTALLSISHRTTGIILSSYAMFLGFGKYIIMHFFDDIPF